MTIEEFKSSLSEEKVNAIKAVLAKSKDTTAADIQLIQEYIAASAQAFGEDQITEAIRYVVTSMGGVRATDLQAIIGDDFNPETFEAWNNVLGVPFLQYRDLPNARLYDFSPELHVRMRDELGESNLRSCASDLGYYLLEHKEAGDIVRDVQITHLLLDGGETAAVAEYVSQAEGEQLRLAVQTLSQALKDGPDYVQACALDMPRCEGEKVNLTKLLMILVNDCYLALGPSDQQKSLIDRMLPIIEELIQQGHQEITVILGLARLRYAQMARLRREEQEAQQAFTAALNYLLPPLQQADPLTITSMQIREYWIALKICQEMIQPKAISIIFESIIRVERAQSQDTNRSEEERGQIAEDIIGQHIDMAKLYYMFPKELQEQFTNYSEPTIALLKTFCEGEADANDAEMSRADLIRMSGYYQTLGELSDHLERHDEAYEALDKAQTLQMRIVGQFKKEEGNKMSPESLVQRLALSVTNHMLAFHYRRQNRSQHDIQVLLTANLNLAIECLESYARDGRVVHFAVNAALELGDLQHRSGGLLAECGTYDKVIRHFVQLNNMRIDGQLCQDIAMIHTRCGQAQMDEKLRRYGDAARNLEVALKLWSTLAQNTKDANYQKNVDFVQQLLSQIKK